MRRMLAVLAFLLIAASPASALPVLYELTGQVYDQAEGAAFHFTGSFLLGDLAVTSNYYNDPPGSSDACDLVQYTLRDVKFAWGDTLVQGTGRLDMVVYSASSGVGWNSVYNSTALFDFASPWRQGDHTEFYVIGDSVSEPPQAFHMQGSSFALYDEAGIRHSLGLPVAHRVPEPSTLFLLGGGLAAFVARRKRRW